MTVDVLMVGVMADQGYDGKIMAVRAYDDSVYGRYSLCQ